MIYVEFLIAIDFLEILFIKEFCPGNEQHGLILQA